MQALCILSCSLYMLQCFSNRFKATKYKVQSKRDLCGWLTAHIFFSFFFCCLSVNKDNFLRLKLWYIKIYIIINSVGKTIVRQLFDERGKQELIKSFLGYFIRRKLTVYNFEYHESIPKALLGIFGNFSVYLFYLFILF